MTTKGWLPEWTVNTGRGEMPRRWSWAVVSRPLLGKRGLQGEIKSQLVLNSFYLSQYLLNPLPTGLFSNLLTWRGRHWCRVLPLNSSFLIRNLIFHYKIALCKYNLEDCREIEGGRMSSQFVTNYCEDSMLLIKLWVYFFKIETHFSLNQLLYL